MIDDVAPDDFEGAFLAGASGTFSAPPVPPPQETPPRPIAAPAPPTPIAAEARAAPVPAMASVENPFASTPYSRGAATNPFGSVPKTLPLGSIPSSSSSSPGGDIEASAAAANPFASADGPLSAQRPPARSSRTPPPPPLEDTFDPFEGDAAETMPPPPPPLDIEGSNPRGGAVPWQDLDKPPPPVSWDQLTEEAEGAPASLEEHSEPSGESAVPSDEGDPDRTREMPLSMVPKLVPRRGSLLADVDAADDAADHSYDDGPHVDDEPTVDTARSPAYLALKREPLGDRLRRLAADLDDEGRHEAAALLLEAARALSAHEG